MNLDTGPTPVHLRCRGTLHGKLREDGLLEIKCHHITCTKGRAASVFHYFDPQTGALVDTKIYQDPAAKLRGRRR